MYKYITVAITLMLAVSVWALDATKPTNSELLSTHAKYIRETRDYANQLAAPSTTEFRNYTSIKRAPLASPTFTGDPKAPTQSQGNSTTSIATTGFVTTGLAGKASLTAFSNYTSIKTSGSNYFSGTNTFNDLVVKGPWIDARAYATLSAADTAATSAGKVLVITSQWNTVPSTLTSYIRFLPGGKLNNSSSVTFTHQPEIGMFQVFMGSGSILGLKESRPEWFGAVVSDGVDDLAYLQKAITSLSGGGTLHLGVGTYKTSDVWTIGDADGYTAHDVDDSSPTLTQNIHVVGEGRQTVIDASSHDKSCIVFYKCLSSSIEKVKVVGSLGEVTKDLFLASGIELIDCAYTNVTDCYVFDKGRTLGGIAGIYVSGCMYCTVARNYVVATGSGIGVDNWYTATSIHSGAAATPVWNSVHDNYVDTEYWGIQIDGGNCFHNSITNNKVFDCGSFGIGISNGSKNTVSHNTVNNCAHGFLGGALGGSTSAGNIVTNNHFNSNLSMGIFISSDNDPDSNFREWVISGNEANDNVEHGLSVAQANKMIITNNVIMRNGKDGLHTVRPSGGDVRTSGYSLIVGATYRIVTRVTLDFTTVGASGNTVGTYFRATGTGPLGTGDSVQGPSATLQGQLQIENNTISSNGWNGVVLFNPYYCQINKNTILSNGTYTDNAYSSIFIDGTSASYNSFEGNILGNTSTSAGVKNAFDFTAAITASPANFAFNIVSKNITYSVRTSFAGTAFNKYNNIVLNNIENGAIRDTVLQGNFDPESAQTAPVGTFFINTGGAAGNVLHIKESGTGNTGWVGK